MQYRRIRTPESAGPGPAALLGLGLGLAAGFLLGEIFGGHGGRRAVGRMIRRLRGGRDPRPKPSEVTARGLAALRQALGAESELLGLVAVGQNAVELHGWVASRPTRTLAIRSVRAALPFDIALVDRLLVWGEDDIQTPDAPLREEPESA